MIKFLKMTKRFSLKEKMRVFDRKIKIIIMLFFILTNIAKTEIVIENFDNIKSFYSNTAPMAKMKLSPDKGLEGKSLKIEYDLTKDHYVQFGTRIKIDLSKVKEFFWYLKGNANGNLIEIKLVDKDGSNFGKKIPITGISENKWTRFVLPLKECHYLWGGDGKIDEIKELWIAISRGLPQAKYVLIDQFGYTEKSEEEPEWEIQLNQVGYHPSDKKFFVVRVLETEPQDLLGGEFYIKSFQNNEVLYKGELIKSNFKDWKGVFLVGEFSDLDKEGEYFIEVLLKTKKGNFNKDSYKFKIKNKILIDETVKLELNYINHQRCGIKCHKQDPIIGGYHDTLFDISKRMWSLPHLTLWMAKYLTDSDYHPLYNEILDEVIWGVKFLAAIPDEEGTVPWGGIESDFENYMSYGEYLTRLGPLKPEDDDLPRKRHTDKSFHATCFNLVALLNSFDLIKDKEPELAEKVLKVCKTAFKWIDSQPLYFAHDYGCYLLAALSMFEYTKDKIYLNNIKSILPKLLMLQALDYNKFENRACGDFYYAENIKDFRFQYKYVSFNIAINLALLKLCEILDKDDPLWFDVYYANRVYGESYLKGISSKTPYRQMGVGLEEPGDKFLINYFSGKEGEFAAAQNHGLNCDHLGRAYIALKWAQYIDDLELEEFADNQVNWVLGCNPLGYCMLIGAGSKNPDVMASYYGKGPVNGIIPNGIVGGENDEPEWWGDGPSSGEDWLPHNSYYFAILSIIENDAELKFKIFNNGRPVSDAIIKISDLELKTDKDGNAGPIKLMGQKSYEITIEKENKKLLKKINLVSGASKELIVDMARDCEIEIKIPSKIKIKSKNIFLVKISGNAEGLPYEIKIKGGKILSPVKGTIKSKKIKLTIISDGIQPLLLRFEIKNRPVISKEIYLTL